MINFNTVFYGQWTKDSIHWYYSSGLWKPENSGAAVFFGWDNKLELTLPFSTGPMEKPVLNLSWHFRLSRLLSGELSFEDALRIPYMPAHTLGISLELPWKTKAKKLSGSFIISGHFERRRFADTGHMIELDSRFLLNVIYNQEVNNNLNVFGRINNVLNAHYVSFADYPMPGIAMTLGLRLQFEVKKVKK
jgi:hypothetical protein